MLQKRIKSNKFHTFMTAVSPAGLFFSKTLGTGSTRVWFFSMEMLLRTCRSGIYSAVIEPNIPVNTSEQACWSTSASRQLQLYNNLRYTYNKDNNVSICR